MAQIKRIETLLSEMIEQQQAKLLRYGCQIIPTLTTDDILQPNDFPELEAHALFRYEEGVLAGLMAFQMALRSERANERTVESAS